MTYCIYMHQQRFVTSIGTTNVTDDACQLIYLCCIDHMTHTGDRSHYHTCDDVTASTVVQDLALQSAINDNGCLVIFLRGVVFGMFLSTEWPSCKQMNTWRSKLAFSPTHLVLQLIVKGEISSTTAVT